MAVGGVSGPLAPAAIQSMIDAQSKIGSVVLDKFNITPTSLLTFEGDVMGELVGHYPTEIDETVGSTAAQTFPYTGRIKFSKVKLLISDKNRANNPDIDLWKKNISKVAGVHMLREEDHVLSTLLGAPYTNNTVTTGGGAWVDDYAPSEDATIEDDVAEMVARLRSNANIQGGAGSTSNYPIHMFLPSDAYAAYASSRLIGNESMMLLDYFKRVHNLQVYDTRLYSGNAAAAAHGLGATPGLQSSAVAFMEQPDMDSIALRERYTFPDPHVPAIEVERIVDKGWQYHSKVGFTFKVIPYASGESTNKNIATIAAVRS